MGEVSVDVGCGHVGEGAILYSSSVLMTRGPYELATAQMYAGGVIRLQDSQVRSK